MNLYFPSVFRNLCIEWNIFLELGQELQSQRRDAWRVGHNKGKEEGFPQQTQVSIRQMPSNLINLILLFPSLLEVLELLSVNWLHGL